MNTDEESVHSADSATAMSTDEECPSDPKVVALQDALRDRKDYQRLLYYTDESEHHR